MELKTKKVVIASIVFGTIAIAVLSYLFLSYGKVTTDNARIKIGDIQIIAEVSGYISKVLIEDNMPVKTGDTLIQIDDTQYQIDYGHAQALSKKANSDLEFLSKEYRRKSNLFRKDFISKSEMDKAENDFYVAQSMVELYKNEVNLAKYRLDRAIIRSPAHGVVSNFSLRVGDFVAVGRPLFHLMDKSDIWVEANFKEIDLRNVKVGQKAKITIDTFGGKVWHAKVQSISSATGAEFSLLPAQNSSGNWIKVVQRIAVRLRFDEGQDISRLASGMSADVEIDTRH